MKKPPPAPPKNRDIRGREYNPNPGTVVFFIGLAMFIGLVLTLSGCERVTEYRCSADQIEKATKQFQWCEQGITVEIESKTRRHCWQEATQAHCDVIADFQRTEIIKPEN